MPEKQTVSPEVEATNPMIELMADVTPHLRKIFLLMGPIVREGDWTSWSEADQVELRKFIAFGYKVFSETLRPKFDVRVWNGQAAEAVKSIRQQSDFKSKPGRKAKSEEEKLAELEAALEG